MKKIIITTLVSVTITAGIIYFFLANAVNTKNREFQKFKKKIESDSASYVSDKKDDSKKSDLRQDIDTTRFNIDKGNLTGNTITINVSYAAIGCTCPQWFETKNMNNNLNGRQYFYLEQGNESITKADTLFDGINLPELTLTGKFYSKEGYPKNYKPSKGDPKPARVFKYDKIKKNRAQ